MLLLNAVYFVATKINNKDVERALPESTIKLTFGVVCMKIVAHVKSKKGKIEGEREGVRRTER